MTRYTFIAIPLVLLLAACVQQDKVIVAMDAIIAAATVDSIIQSNNPAVVAFDGIVIDDASRTIDLWVSQQHTTALIGDILHTWDNLLKNVNPSIGPIVEAIVRAVQRFMEQLQTVPVYQGPKPEPAKAKRTAPKLSKADNAKITDMREKLRLAKAKLAGNPAFKK